MTFYIAFLSGAALGAAIGAFLAWNPMPGWVGAGIGLVVVGIAIAGAGVTTLRRAA